ncbi:hypothetical protein [Blastopirellula marina]|uniref:Uncharacterized protein n=1 Tax=Blastopirellula marina DSM 3645 TaxID=314230 RepID=A3ZQZ4_9BACT|nr:hypothetical protein [Blastopirellula marina]EAQ81087.1 hypothetical protein DSM3645_20987 [Blastopirellula marina DSM 3645]
MNLKAMAALLGMMMFATLAHAGGWGEMMGYSSAADCGCASTAACGPNCANVWDGYCADQSCGRRSPIQGRYHWFALPTACGCGPTCATGACCDEYPMCNCNGPHFERVCEKCPSCLKMFKVRGYSGGSCGAPGCSACGQASTRIIQLGQPSYQEIQMMPSAPRVPTKEAKLIYPSHRATLPN